ncbi:Protein TOXD [Madurella mycetomatis]|uniref:Protein TOXD n=1 Tax=Madurella mycetomatis TaxID=100816 RepID=A0A175WCY6_9PEZI|nr:Protein TOXD [Madurella mycetomatis]
MADSTRTAIYLSPEGPILKDIAERYRPTGAQSLLCVEYSGINPADVKHATIGYHSSVAGYEMSGHVLEAAPDSPFKPGDKIFGIKPPPAPNGRCPPAVYGSTPKLRHGGQPLLAQSPVAGGLGLREAASLPVMTMTAADGLFNLLGLAFPGAGVRSGSESQGLLVWGGASSVGLAVVQLAKAAGHGPIFVTASAKNHETLRALGADRCFDYKADDVVERIREAIRDCGRPVRHAFDAVGVGSLAEGDDFGKSSPGLTAASVSFDGQRDQDVKLVCVLPVREDSRYKLCFATRNHESPMELARMADPEAWYGMQAKVMAWVTANYGEGMYVGSPNITTVKGTRESLDAMRRSAEGKYSLEKVVIEHPL